MIDDGAYEEETANVLNYLDSDNYNDDYDVIVMPSHSNKNNFFQQKHFYHSDHELRQSRESSIDMNHVKLKLNSSTDQALLNLKQMTQRQRKSKHDLSSNTLSVDSGLSVPTGGTTTTSTNSEPESEKSGNNHNFLTNAIASVSANAASVLIQINKHLNRNENDDKCSIASSESSSAQNNQQLKRQKRMLYLNSNPSSMEQEDNYVAIKNPNEEEDYFYTRKINKKLIESSSLDSILISDKNPSFGSINLDEINKRDQNESACQAHTKKRCSVKLVAAPLAPHLQKQRQEEEKHNLPHVVLVPYEVPSKHLPSTYQKTDFDQSITSVKSKASLDLNEVVTTANLLASSLNNLNDNNVRQKISNSTLTDSNMMMHNTTTNTTTTTFSQPNQSYFNQNRHPHARRRSIVKISIEKTFNTLQTSLIKNIQTGFGLASDLMISPVKNTGNTTANSSTTENFIDQDDLYCSSTDLAYTSTSFGSTQSNTKLTNFDKTPSPKISSTVYVPYSPIKLLSVNPIDEKTHHHSSSVFSNNSYKCGK